MPKAKKVVTMQVRLDEVAGIEGWDGFYECQCCRFCWRQLGLCHRDPPQGFRHNDYENGVVWVRPKVAINDRSCSSFEIDKVFMVDVRVGRSYSVGKNADGTPLVILPKDHPAWKKAVRK